MTNRSRLRTGPQIGAGNGAQLVGDYTNPILQPWAAEVLKKFGEISLSGKGFPTPRNQCWPEQVPFVFANYGMQLLQGADRITILYPYDHQYRQFRMNAPHPAELTPSWYGDLVGHYEGDTLVVDTVGVKVGPFSMIDWFGTPFTSALHMVERYRRLDIEATMEAIRRDAKENFHFANPDNGPIVDAAYKGDGLQIELTVEDEGAFTMPWTALVTLRRARRRAARTGLRRKPAMASGNILFGADRRKSGFLIAANRPSGTGLFNAIRLRIGGCAEEHGPERTNAFVAWSLTSMMSALTAKAAAATMVIWGSLGTRE